MDLDGDNQLDVLALVGPDRMPVAFYQQGAGQFTDGMPLSGLSSATTLSTGDLDGDGDQDVIAVGDDSGFIQILENVSPRSFIATAITLSSDYSGANLAVVADLNRDGQLDLITGGDDLRWPRCDSIDHQLILSES